jgi:putative ABC transport system permease protein
VLLHDLRLALRSFKRTPILTVLMVTAIAAGIGAAMITITLYHARAGHPIWWKEDKLFAVALDNRGSDHKGEELQKHPEYPPNTLSYRDAKALYASRIPTHAVRMYQTYRTLDPGRAGIKPFGVQGRVMTADFFTMFDVPMKYGTGWNRAADEAPEPVVVIGKRLNEKLFDGANSVGKSVTLSAKQFRVIGVVDSWMPTPKFYDVNAAFGIAEDFYLPFGWAEALQLPPAGVGCVTPDAKVNSFVDLLTADCNMLQYWVELPTRESVDRFRQFVDNYTVDEKRHGRFVRAPNNRVLNVTDWLALNDVIGDESRVQVGLAAMFLGVCILNTLGLMLAKFLGAAHVTGLRRALGASRKHIIRQHLTEVVVVGLVGGMVGIVFAWLGLWAIRVLTFIPGPNDSPDRLVMAQSLSHMDLRMLGLALLISMVTGIVAGLYPAWRIGRAAPATFLKT